MSCDVGEATASFSNPYIASPTSQVILQPFCRFTYVTTHSTAFPLLHLHHRHFTYITWWAAHAPMMMLKYIHDDFIICNVCGPQGLYERWKLALKLKRLKTPVLQELGLEPILQYIHQYQDNWLQKVKCTPRSRIPRAVFNYRPSGKRSLFHPVKRWWGNFL